MFQIFLALFLALVSPAQNPNNSSGPGTVITADGGTGGDNGSIPPPPPPPPPGH